MFYSNVQFEYHFPIITLIYDPRNINELYK
jgi:hypothetical protein